MERRNLLADARAAQEAAERITARQREQDHLERVRRQETENINCERAAQFIRIMRTHKVPLTGLYNEIAETKYPSPGALYMRREVVGLEGPRMLGWVAFRPWLLVPSNPESPEYPGAFVTENGRTYECDAEKVFQGTRYVTLVHHENSTILAEPGAWDRMVSGLAERGIL